MSFFFSVEGLDCNFPFPYLSIKTLDLKKKIDSYNGMRNLICQCHEHIKK